MEEVTALNPVQGSSFALICIRYSYTYLYIHIFNERLEGRKKEASNVKQANKAKQHSTPKAVTFPKKNELP